MDKPEMSEEEAKLRREALYLIYKKGWLTQMDEEPQSLELPPMPDWEEAETELHRFREKLFHDLGKALASGTVLAPSAWKEGLDENELSSRHQFRDQWEALHTRAIDVIDNQDLELRQEARIRAVDREAIDRGESPELRDEKRDETRDERRVALNGLVPLDRHYSVLRFLVRYVALGNFVRLNQGKLGHPGKYHHAGSCDRAWQKKAFELMRDFIRGPQRGVILGDGMGLGKTLTVIALIMHLRLKPYEGPVLVGRQPKVIVWDNTELTTSDLLGGDYDIVITSYHFLMHRVKELDFGTRVGQFLSHGTKEEISVVRKLRRLSFEVARAVTRPMPASRMRWKFSAQHETHQALHSQPYKRFVGTTGTFMPNKWTDIYRMIALLPGNPFDSYDHFVKSFGTITKGRPSERCNEAALIYYLDSLVVARPQRILRCLGHRWYPAGLGQTTLPAEEATPPCARQQRPIESWFKENDITLDSPTPRIFWLGEAPKITHGHQETVAMTQRPRMSIQSKRFVC
ncbi:Putative P-loop containing nucleoside triphosphate hydrolase, SNF2-like domain superfamily [Colletotrichum destructivum]|uniref:P-loop containing nucleoside triphosphate hydrolase, SNF2-like domain superfamily n=1 Tax=Colletotrichum destructivum TaxID=34406 RepID=A0AAX4HYR3_9PEZI|nr:Putative P-loop containing nucleoside triphosphate hydrolase, SNF2-like domain superfamily [Colletotrichum destructivum]